MNSAVLRATAVALAVSIAACSVIDPYMLPPQLSIDDTQKQFQHESKNAFSLYKTYGEGRNEMRLFSLYSGLVLTGLGLAGLGVALFQASNNALFGVGLAAASVGGLRAFVPFDARRRIYAGGQKAIFCSVSALSLSAVLQPKDKDEDKDRDRETDTGGSTTLIPQAQTREQRLGSVINDLEKLQSDPPATELSSRVAEPTARAMAQVAGSNTSVAIRAGALESSRASLVEALRKVEDMANRSLSDAERARFLQMALIAIDLAVQDQLDQADFDPDKALKASGSTIGPWVKGFMDTIIAARSEVRRVRNEANKLMGALQVAAVTGEAPVQDAKDFVSKVRESADRADAILQQIWSLTRLPSECYNGFAGGIQQSSEPSQEGS